jgi:hypothetical protein
MEAEVREDTGWGCVACGYGAGGNSPIATGAACPQCGSLEDFGIYSKESLIRRAQAITRAAISDSRLVGTYTAVIDALVARLERGDE